MERGRDNRSRRLPRSYTYVSVHTSKDQCIKFYWIFEREKQLDDIR